jgi:glycosyltransferase involved in cell wall biosynthesis
MVAASGAPIRRPTRVVFVTQQFTPSHRLLAATVPQIGALAKLVDEVVVIADEVDESALPANARAYSFRSRTKLGRGLRFTLALLRELRGLRGGGFVVAHMCAVYAVLAAPFVRPLRVPLLIWYVHWKKHFVIRAAERLVTAVVTVDESSFPFPSSKLHPNGQAIDTAALPCRSRPAAPGRLEIRMIGRYSPSKGVDTVLRALAIAARRGLDVRLQVNGPAFDAEASAYREQLERLVTELDLGDRVTLADALPHESLADAFAATDLLVNNAAGGADKIVYEAAASCVPVLASNPANFAIVPPDWRFRREDADDLAARLLAFAALDGAARAELGQRLREDALQNHSIESWARGLLAAAGFA